MKETGKHGSLSLDVTSDCQDFVDSPQVIIKSAYKANKL